MLKKLFKGVKSLVKKAAPLIGLAAPALFPTMSPFLAGALGGGVASLIGGAKPKDALASALMGATLGKIGGPGIASLKSGAGLGAAAKAVGKGLTDATLADKLLLSAATGAAAGLQTPKVEKIDMSQYKGPKRGEYGTLFDFEEQIRNPDIRDLDPIQYYASGGQATQFPRQTGMIRGPGTETSDDIPAMLSNNEFVMTAKAVKGLGSLLGGKNEKQKIDIGTEGMYGIMDRFSKQV